MSLSARRAWIEMDVTAKTGLFTSVALRKESVDRNPSISGLHPLMAVALRKESVDRNPKNPMIRIDKIVALRKESVDRNVLLYIL